MSNDAAAPDDDAAAAAAAAKQQELEDFAKTFDATPGNVSVSRTGPTSSTHTRSMDESVRGRRSRSNNPRDKKTRARSSNPVPKGSPLGGRRVRTGSRVGRKNRRRSSSLDARNTPNDATNKYGKPGLRTAKTMTTTTTRSIGDHFSKRGNTSMPRRDSDDMSLLSAFDTGALHEHLADASAETKRISTQATIKEGEGDVGGNIFTRRAEQDLREVDQSVNLMNAEAGLYDVSESDKAAGGTPPRTTSNRTRYNRTSPKSSFLSMMFGTNRSKPNRSISNTYHKDLQSRGKENLPINQTPNMKYPRTSMQEIQLGPDPTRHRQTAFYLQQRAAERDNPWNNFKRFCTKVTRPVKQLVCSPPFLTAIVLLVTLVFWIPYLQEKINHRVIVLDANATSAPTPGPTRAPTPSAHESFLDMAGDLLYGSFGQPRPAPVDVAEEETDSDESEEESKDGEVVHSGAGEAAKPNPTAEDTVESRTHTASGEISKKDHILSDDPEDAAKIRKHTASGEISKNDDTGDTRASGEVSQADRENQPSTGEVSQSDRDDSDENEALTQEDRDSIVDEDMVLDYHGTLGEQLELFKGVIMDQGLSSEEVLNDHGSNQFQALMWLSMSSLDNSDEEDNVNRRGRQMADTGLTVAQLKERYVAAVFYFATRMDNADDSNTGVARPPRNHTGPVAPEKQSITIDKVAPSGSNGDGSGRLLKKPFQIKFPPSASSNRQKTPSDSKDNEDVHLENWLTVEDLCVWEGIACNDDGYVNRVTLSNKALHGTIPSEIHGFSVSLYIG